jgi:hypothetical protein
VPGRVALVVLQLVRRDLELLADLTMWTTERTIRTIISNPTIRLIAFDVDIIAPIGVRLAAAWSVGLSGCIRDLYQLIDSHHRFLIAAVIFSAERIVPSPSIPVRMPIKVFASAAGHPTTGAMTDE